MARRVPDLKYSLIDRDAWTRLNVKPAKNNAGQLISVCQYSIWTELINKMLYYNDKKNC